MNVFVEFLITHSLSASASIVVYVILSRALLTTPGVQRFVSLMRAFFSRWASFAFWILVLTYVLVFSTLSILRHQSFHSAGFDLGIFDQAVWNSMQGRLLQVSIVPDTPNLLGQRFSPILLAFVPLYSIWSDPIVLLIVQTVALAASVIPVYWYGRRAIGSAVTLAIVLAFLVSPSLQYINLYEFHEVALTAPLFAFATWFLLRQSWRGMLVCLGLALLTKEEIGLTLIVFGVFVFFIQRRRWLGVALSIFGLGWTVALLQYVIPAFRGADFGSGYYYFGHGVAAGTGRYDYLGQSLPEIATTILARPDRVLQMIFTSAKVEYVLHLLAPFAFIPLAGAEVAMLGLVTLGLSVISSFPFQSDISSHYAAPLLPFLSFATVLGVKRLLGSRKVSLLGLRTSNPVMDRIPLQGALAVLLIVAAGASYYFHAPGPLARHYDSAMYAVDGRTTLGNALLYSIPHDAVVVANDEIQAHLSQRQYLYEIPRIADYRQADYLVADTTRHWYNVFNGYWGYFWGTGYFDILTNENGFIVAKRITPTSPQIQFAERITLLGFTIPMTSTIRGGTVLRPIAAWRADQPITERYNFTVQVEDATGHIWAIEEREPHDGQLPTDQWERGKPVGEQYTLKLPPTMPTGDYAITLAVKDRAGAYLAARDMDANALGAEAVIATTRVEKNKSSFTASDLRIEQPLQVDMREIRLLGFVPPRETITPGELLQVGLYWRARGKPQGNYIVAVQLRDASGKIAFEHTTRPANDTYPTTQWETGEVLLDWHDFDLPRGLAPGEYQIFVVLRERASVLGEIRIAPLTVVK